MKAKQLHKLGVPRGKATRLTLRLIDAALSSGVGKDELRPRIAAVVADPAGSVEDPIFGDLARMLLPHDHPDSPHRDYKPHPEGSAPWRQWGEDLDANALEQMDNAARLPIAVRGALMPDAHVGYGLPIGGVLATDNAVIPYAVGVDIACRMKLTVLDLPADLLQKQSQRLIDAIERNTRFGMGANFGKHPCDHPVMDEDWSITAITRQQRDKAHQQLGTSGSGNHFVEFGELLIEDAQAARTLDLPGPGTYLALLSHSGSRGPGATVAGYYSRLAMHRHPELPRHLAHLAWLDLDRAEGQGYWAAMELMGRYASANHACIHRNILRHLDAQAVMTVENHHNFAWCERHEGRDLIVHRKGATPAGEGVLGVIPGSMTAPAFIVRGRGEPASLNSAAHGAGRVMSRREARQTYRWKQVRDYLEHRGVTVLSAGLDEVPFVYKDIEKVMSLQQDLVEPLARFQPRIVKMAPEGERPED